MPIVLEMPALSPTMEKGNLVNWIKQEGDAVEIGDVLAEIDTDKATMEFESMYDGVLEKIVVAAGTPDVLVKTPIAVIRQKNDTDEDIQKALESLNSTKTEQVAQSVEEPAVVEERVEVAQNAALSVASSEKIKASPLAKRIANEYGIDLSKLMGTGPGGRIVKADVLGYSENKPDESLVSDFVDEPLSNMRRVIAERLTKSKQETPHFYMNVSADVSLMLKLRRIINDSKKVDTKITVNDFIVKAVATALASFPEINVSFVDGKLRKYNNIDISVAVSIDGGLITPIVKNADKKSLKEISKEIKDLASRAKEGKLKLEEFQGGSITISNLGMFQIDGFFPIINPPQGSILSIGPAKKAPVVDKDDNIVVAQVLNIGYAIDHRVIDGAVAAKFLEHLKSCLENPFVVLV